jgi:hypothetical protein
MNKGLVLMMLGAILLGAGCIDFESIYINDEESPADTEHVEAQKEEADTVDIVSEVDEPTTESMDYIAKKSDLIDITGGESSGTVFAQWIEESSEYHLLSASSNLPFPEDGFFYEGWIVHKDSLDILSTGMLKLGELATWKNDFKSTENLIDYESYVITLEPDDDDPAPAEHILEGEMK